MRAKSFVASLIVGATVVAPIAPAAVAGASPAVTATYSCAVSGVGTESATGTVLGKAASSAGVITLNKTVFTITDSFGLPITVNHVKVYVPDPNTKKAPYQSGTVKVATSPAGWTAGHDTTGIYALHAGSLTAANGAKISSAALSAKYADKGPAGTVIAFKPGKITFTVTSPISASVSCKPIAPVPTFAKVTE